MNEHIEKLNEETKLIPFGTKQYWELRCRYLEKYRDPTYSKFERHNCYILYRILVNKER